MKRTLRAALAVAGSLCLAGNAAAAINWAGNVFPNDGTNILPTGSQDVYAQVYKEGVTEPAGQGADLSAVLNYTSDVHGTFQLPMTYLGDVGSNDEYTAVIPQAHILGSSTIVVHVVFADATDGSEYTDTNDQNGNPPPQTYNVSDVLPNDIDVTFTLCLSGAETAGPPCVIGSAAEIGGWVDGIPMTEIDPELYEVTVTFLAGGNPGFEYKYKKDDCQTWEDSGNHVVTLPTDGTTSVVFDPDSFNQAPIGCGLGNILDEDKEVCFAICLAETENTGSVCVIGNVDELGNWGDGIPLVEGAGGLWEGCIVFASGSPFPINVEYKYKKDDCQTWESVDNRLFTIDNGSPATQLFEDTWDNNPDLDCAPVPTFETSWGEIKQTYRR